MCHFEVFFSDSSKVLILNTRFKSCDTELRPVNRYILYFFFTLIFSFLL